MDDATVASVQVLDEKGEAPEKGEGIKKKGGWWEYTPISEGKVVAERGTRQGMW